MTPIVMRLPGETWPSRPSALAGMNRGADTAAAADFRKLRRSIATDLIENVTELWDGAEPCDLSRRPSLRSHLTTLCGRMLSILEAVRGQALTSIPIPVYI